MYLSQARELMESGDFTCVLTDGDQVFTSVLRGVRPLVQFLERGTDMTGFSAADKVVGRATAYLYVLLGVGAVYARIISEPAVAVLQAHGIRVEYGRLVPNIINRRGDGICPFEAAVMEISEPNEAYRAILRKMQEMNIPITD